MTMQASALHSGRLLVLRHEKERTKGKKKAKKGYLFLFYVLYYFGMILQTHRNDGRKGEGGCKRQSSGLHWQ